MELHQTVHQCGMIFPAAILTAVIQRAWLLYAARYRESIRGCRSRIRFDPVNWTHEGGILVLIFLQQQRPALTLRASHSVILLRSSAIFKLFQCWNRLTWPWCAVQCICFFSPATVRGLQRDANGFRALSGFPTPRLPVS